MQTRIQHNRKPISFELKNRSIHRGDQRHKISGRKTSGTFQYESSKENTQSTLAVNDVLRLKQYFNDFF